MSQIELAELLGVKPTTVCNWESYSAMPAHQHPGFLRARDVLGIDSDLQLNAGG